MTNQSAVNHHPPIDHDGGIEDRHRATRADRQWQTAFGEDEHLSHLQVGRYRPERNPGLFEFRYWKIVSDEIFGPFTVIKPQARNGHTAQIIPADFQRQRFDLIRCEARCVCSADQRSDTRPGDQVDGDLILLQIAQYPDVRTTTSHSTAKCESDQRPIYPSIIAVFCHNFRSLQKTSFQYSVYSFQFEGVNTVN